MNQSNSITGRPRIRKTDLHNLAKAQARIEGLAAWALANGYIAPDGSPLIHSAAQRRMVERALARKEGAQ